jgi:hypothetical protein
MPLAVSQISRHCHDQQPERLLVVAQYAGIKRGAHWAAIPGQKTLAEPARSNPLSSAVFTPTEGLANSYPFRPGESDASKGFQQSGKSSAIRLWGCVLTRSSTSRRYAKGSTSSSLQVAHRLINVAAVLPPSSLPAKSQFFLLC